MADVNKLVPFILRWESDKYVNDPADRGGPTKYGITLATWRHVGYDKDGDGRINAEDIKRLDKSDFARVLKRNFWDRWQADRIKSQSVADMLVDWVWTSGVYGIKIPQSLLGVKIDGVVGPQTITAVNSQEPHKLFDRIKKERLRFVARIVRNNPGQKRFLNGWNNRINALTFKI